MYKRNEANFYVVWHGRLTGIFHSRKQLERSVAGFPEARYKGFPTPGQAQKAINYELGPNNWNDFDHLPFYQSTLNQFQGYRITEGEVRRNIQRLERMFEDCQNCERHFCVQAITSHFNEEEECFIDDLFAIRPKMGSVAACGLMDPKTNRIAFGGVDISKGEVLFAERNIEGIGLPAAHFLSCVYALVHLKKNQIDADVFTKSSTAYLLNRRLFDSLFDNIRAGSEQYNLLMAAIDWCQLNQGSKLVFKWQDEEWGELPVISQEAAYG